MHKVKEKDVRDGTITNLQNAKFIHIINVEKIN